MVLTQDGHRAETRSCHSPHAHPPGVSGKRTVLPSPVRTGEIRGLTSITLCLGWASSPPHPPSLYPAPLLPEPQDECIFALEKTQKLNKDGAQPGVPPHELPALGFHSLVSIQQVTGQRITMMDRERNDTTQSLVQQFHYPAAGFWQFLKSALFHV